VKEEVKVEWSPHQMKKQPDKDQLEQELLHWVQQQGTGSVSPHSYGFFLLTVCCSQVYIRLLENMLFSHLVGEGESGDFRLGENRKKGDRACMKKEKKRIQWKDES
jgi:hypothetical protein